MIIKIVKEDTKEYFDKKDAVKTGASEEFLKKFEVVRMETKGYDPVTGQPQYKRLEQYVPVNKGIIVYKSPDCFGKAFQDQYGSDRECPDIGDLILFIPNKSYSLDLENEYHLVDDNSILGYVKAEDLINE